MGVSCSRWLHAAHPCGSARLRTILDATGDRQLEDSSNRRLGTLLCPHTVLTPRNSYHLEDGNICPDALAMDRSSAVSGSEASSSSSHGTHSHSDNEDRDEPDLLLGDDLLDDDPLREDLSEPLSFKRRPKPTFFSQPGRFLASLAGRSRQSGRASPLLGRSPAVPLDSSAQRRQRSPRQNGQQHGGAHLQRPNQHTKNGGVPLDWYVEGPGRRVGYEDLTAIDWIFEYTKERQRLRVLYSSATGILGHARKLLDASQVWVVLVLTGLAVGLIAAAIDVTTDWLGDLKTGYCSSGPDGGAFYLSRGFCCLGYDEGAQCQGWRPWAAALGISSEAGKWFIEYFFFIWFSVSLTDSSVSSHPGLMRIPDHVGGVGGNSGQGVRDLRKTQWHTRDQDGFGRVHYPAVPGRVDVNHEITGLGKVSGLAGHESNG